MKFFGKIGFIRTDQESEVKKGVYLPSEETRDYYGDVVTNRRIWEKSDKSSNDDLQVTNSISIVADSYMMDNRGYMKYVIWEGLKWEIRSITIEFPRITIDLGGIYHE